VIASVLAPVTLDCRVISVVVPEPVVISAVLSVLVASSAREMDGDGSTVDMRRGRVVEMEVVVEVVLVSVETPDLVDSLSTAVASRNDGACSLRMLY
jgi:hypothetical protein